MKTAKMILVAVLALVLGFSTVFAAGNMEKGKALFNDPKAFNAPGEKSCATCHPGGKGLERAGAPGRTEWTNPGGAWLSLEDACNVCIMMANKGKTIDPRSEEMKDLVAYIKSLGKKK